MCRRAQAGRTVLFAADVEIEHLRGRSAPVRRTAAAYRRSQIAFYAKHHPAMAAMASRLPEGSRRITR